MKFYEATVTIQADPPTIWAILEDVSNYPTWDSGVLNVEGRLEPGEKLKLTSEANPKRAYPIRVAEVVPNQKMVWTGGMPLGLFKGIRTYKLSPQGNGQTRFVMREEFSGPMLPMIWKSMPDLQPSFDKFASGLKRRAETGS
jgi:hypothetical protein